MKDKVTGVQSNSKRFSDEIITGIYQLIEGILQGTGLELVDVQYRREAWGWVLRIFIDKKGGITIEDCTTISRQAGDLLDAKNLIPQAYQLEVSSPGLNRPLKSEEDWKRFIGETIILKTSCPIEQRKNFKGKLIGYNNGTIVMDIDGKHCSIPYKIVEKANVEYNFDKELPC